MPVDIVVVRPFQDRPAGELGSIVADNAGRFAIQTNQRIQFPCYAGTRDAGNLEHDACRDAWPHQLSSNARKLRTGNVLEKWAIQININ